ncbi:uncharacterized protein [Montipora capricornis]|uniref:uncharacterized protein n=1 Tax=Montipora capricornis TaxID=246305 RepID=UPI0035F15E7F
MCRWGCPENKLIFKCKFCGTNYCKTCGRGDFHGVMTDKAVCRVCFQPKCQGERIGQGLRKTAKTDKETVKATTVKAKSPKKQQDKR